MALAGVKRRKLNPEVRNRDRNTREPVAKAPVDDKFDEEEELDDDDDYENEADSTAFAKPGASYSLLLNSFKLTNGKLGNKKEPKKQSQNNSKLETTPPSSNDEAVEEDEDEDPDEELADAQVHGDLVSDPFEDDDEDAADPFETHFATPPDSLIVDAVKAAKEKKWEAKETTQVPLGRQTLIAPSSDKALVSIAQVSSIKDLNLKKRLVETGSSILTGQSSFKNGLARPIFSYQDLLYCGRTPQNANGLRDVACLHAVNHVLKTRDRVIKNTARLSKEQKDDMLELRDQGFTRPKVLILLETRNMCARYMESITKIFDPEQQENKKRFQNAFVESNARVSTEKPPDFQELFEGNDDNEFRMGVKFTRRSIKYYSPFYTSDIILASPLGLRRAVNPDDPKKHDSDFLSSIEIVIVDQTDAMLMQNWEHVEFAFENLNLQPKAAHDCDFSRVRHWYLDQLAKYLRQTIVFSGFLTPDLNGLFSSQMQNVAGKVKIIPDYTGVIENTGISVRQTFSRIHSKTPSSDPDDRFKYFINTIVPQLSRSAGPSGEGVGALVFIPSYLDFVRVRNYFSTSPDIRNVTFGSISEYSDVPSSRRARSYFASGKQSVMLYTGRAHHFRRYHIRGVKRVILYGLPENPIFYNEVVAGFLSSAVADGKLDMAEASAKIMFSRWDGFALERIVGRTRATRMLKESGGDTFDFR